MAPAAPSLTSGTGQLRDLAQERYLAEGNGVGFGGGQQDGFDPGDGYGTGGPTGAPSTGNFFDDVVGFGKNAAPAIAGLLGGPAGLVGVVGGIMGAGALRGLGYERPANALIGNVIGVQGLDQPSVVSEFGNPGNTPTPDGGNFGPDANTAGGPVSDPSMESTVDASAMLGSMGQPPGVSSMDGMTGDPNGALGNPGDYGTPEGGNFGDGANSSGGEGMNSGGESNTSDGTAGVGSSGTWRYGGYTGHGQNGMIDPDAEAGTVHEGEYVLRHEATQHYGADIMHALNSGMIPRNALAALAMQRRPQAANHLLQMMMR
jgi:hypothetical protein